MPEYQNNVLVNHFQNLCQIPIFRETSLLICDSTGASEPPIRADHMDELGMSEPLNTLKIEHMLPHTQIADILHF